MVGRTKLGKFLKDLNTTYKVSVRDIECLLGETFQGVVINILVSFCANNVGCSAVSDEHLCAKVGTGVCSNAPPQSSTPAQDFIQV